MYVHSIDVGNNDGQLDSRDSAKTDSTLLTGNAFNPDSPSFFFSSVDERKLAAKNNSFASYSSLEESLIKVIELLCGSLDVLHLLRGLGTLRKGHIAPRTSKRRSKLADRIWLVALLLTARRVLTKLVRLFRTRKQLKMEISKQQQQQQPHESARGSAYNILLRQKLLKTFRKCTHMIWSTMLEFMQVLTFLFLTILDAFNFQRLLWLKRYLEPVQSTLTVLRLLHSATSIVSLAS